MRILTLNYEFPPIGGGGSPVSYELSRELVAQGHQVDVVTMGFDGLPAREVVDGINVYRVPCLRKRRELCKTHEMASFVLAALPRAARLAASRNYDVNHTHFIVPTGLLARLLKTWTGLPFVVTVHGSDVPGYNPDRFGLQHRLLGPIWKLDRATAPIRSSRPRSSCESWSISGRTVGRSASSPTGSATSASGPICPKDRRILLVSSHDAAQGRAVSAGGPARPRPPGFRGRHRRRRPLPVDAQANGRGALPAGEVLGMAGQCVGRARHLYERSSIFAFTSEAENFPTVLLEAMAAGQAIVTCDGTGAPRSSATTPCWCRRAGRMRCARPSSS